MSLKYKIIALVAVVLVSFAVGRYSAPQKVTEVKHEQTDEKKNSEQDKEKHTKTKIVIITKPDGTKKEVKIIDEDDKTKSKSSDKVSKTEDSSKITEYKKPALTISALAAAKPFSGDFKPNYGGMVSKQVLGPISVGAFGFQSGLVGISAGISF